MFEACPLKVRAYLAAGLPVYAGHPDIFPIAFPYYRQGKCDFKAITDFALENRAVEKADIALASKPYIDKKALVGSLYSFVENHAGSFGSRVAK